MILSLSQGGKVMSMNLIEYRKNNCHVKTKMKKTKIALTKEKRDHTLVSINL